MIFWLVRDGSARRGEIKDKTKGTTTVELAKIKISVRRRIDRPRGHVIGVCDDLTGAPKTILVRLRGEEGLALARALQGEFKATAGVRGLRRTSVLSRSRQRAGG